MEGWAEWLKRGAGTVAKGHPRSSLPATPRPAIPGGLLSSRARVGPNGQLDHRRLLSGCQEFLWFVGAPGLGELAVALGPDGLGAALDLVEGRHAADGAVEPNGVVVVVLACASPRPASTVVSPLAAPTEGPHGRLGPRRPSPRRRPDVASPGTTASSPRVHARRHCSLRVERAGARPRARTRGGRAGSRFLARWRSASPH